MAEEKKSEFEKVAKKNSSIVGDFIDYLKANKKWWLLPIILLFLFLGALAVIGGSGAAPFIYTLF